MSHSWERITSFVPWVTHGVELCAFIVRKMPKSMHNIRKEFHNLPQKNIIGYEADLNPSGDTKGAPCSYFTSDVKVSHIIIQAR